MVRQHGNGLTDKALNAHQVPRFGGFTEGKGLPCPSSSGGTANSVDVGFGLVGQIVVEDVRDTVHIDATAGDVGGHKNGNVPGFECIKRSSSGPLRFVAVDGSGINAGLTELFHQPIRAVFGSGEHDAAMHLLVNDDINECTPFVGLFHEHHVLFNAVHGDGFGRDLHGDHVTEEAVGQRGDGLRHGGAEQQVLALVGEDLQHLLDVVNEAHVEHAVRFIKHKELNVSQIDVSLTHQVQQPSGCGHENVNATLKGSDLRVLIDAAEDHLMAQPHVTAVGCEPFTDLCRQFSCGRQHEGSDVPLPLWLGFRHDVQHREGERSRFSRPGLSDTKDVPSFKQRRYGSFLHRCRLLVPFPLDGIQQHGSQSQIRKHHHACSPFPPRWVANHRRCSASPSGPLLMICKVEFSSWNTFLMRCSCVPWTTHAGEPFASVR